MTTARLLRHARRRAGLTQRRLAAVSGVPQATVGRIEAGTVSPRADTLARLLSATGYQLAIEPMLGVGVDRTLIRQALAKTPERRITDAAAAAHNLAAFLGEVGRGARL